ncbi:MAG: hypothetical protein NVSMB63_01600 [Sediminibacterium sp.]
MRQVGDGTRALNFFIDTMIVFTLAFISFKTWDWYVLYWGYKPHNFGWFFFGMLFVYYTFFEALFARTPAKWFTYTKVIRYNERRPGIGRVLIRSLVRLTLIDMFFIPFLGKPLHDALSKTKVVEV